MEAIAWAREHGAGADTPDVVSDLPWARVTRIGDVWLKECRPVQAYEVPLTVRLASRRPDRLPPVLAADPERSWLLLGDAGTPIAAFGDARDAWLAALPLYAELQQRETEHAGDHLAAGVPDLRPHTLPGRFDAFAETEPRLAPSSSRFAALCAALTRPSTVQHDDLHESNVFARDRHIRFLDWGDTCIAHPFASLYITFRHVEHLHGGDWLPDLRRAYLEPWGSDLDAELDAALLVAAFARLLQWQRIAAGTDADEPREAIARNLVTFLDRIRDA